MEAVKRKIRSLQEQADCAGERTERIQQQLLAERKAREQVSMFTARPARQERLIKTYKYASSSCSLFCLMCLPFMRQLELMHSEISPDIPQRCRLSCTWLYAVPPQSTLLMV